MTKAESSKKIILVDDNDLDAQVFTLLLEELEYKGEIHILNHGTDALAYLKNLENNSVECEQICLVVLDINIPEVNGRQLLKYIKENRLLCYLPTVMCSSSLLAEDINKSYLAGANGYVCKLPDMDEMRDVVKAILDYWVEVNVKYRSSSNLREV